MLIIYTSKYKENIFFSTFEGKKCLKEQFITLDMMEAYGN